MSNNAEKKNISRLDFKVDDAINSLKAIDKELETIAKSSEAYAKKIGENINKSMKNVSFIDTTKVKEDADKSIKINQDVVNEAIKKDKVLKRKLILQNNEHNNTIAEQNNKARLKQEANNDKLLKSTKTMYDKITNYAKTYLIYQGFNELRKGIVETIEEMVEVEYQMVQIDRVLNESSLDIDNYRDKLIQLAYDYGNSFENVADITLRLAQAGFDSQEALMLTEKTLLALNTAELDATQATEDMVAVMAQWGLMTGTATEQADSYGEIIDKINKVADNFPTTSADILEALKKTSSAFNLAGASIDETIASIVAAETASQRGGKAIGTALNNIITQLKDANRLETMKGLGIEIYTDETETEFNNIMDIMSQLSEKMQKLKDDGKESSVEMQSLLEVFTVFRRNIGSSLLGEMAGEDSTYSKVIKEIQTSLGYSLQENEKHMKTAKAAQAQFNSELLKLKTTVWEGGVEDVFRSMLALGTDLVKGFGFIIDKIGLLPAALGAATLAFTAFNKQIKMQVTYNSTEGWGFNSDLINKIKRATKELKLYEQGVYKVKSANYMFSDSFKNYVSKLGDAQASTKGYIGYLIKQKVATIAAEAATIALNAALSFGLSAAITLIISGITKLINAEKEAVEAAQNAKDEIQGKIEKYEEEINEIKELTEEYDNLKKSYEALNSKDESERSLADEQEMVLLAEELKVQEEKITEFLKEQREYNKEIVGDYEAQNEKAKEILKTKKEELLVTQKNALIAARESVSPQKFVGHTIWGINGDAEGGWKNTLEDLGFNKDYFNQLDSVAAEYAEAWGGLNTTVWEYMNELTSSEQVDVLEEMIAKLQEGYFAGKDYGDIIVYLESKLTPLKENFADITEASDALNNTLGEIDLEEMIGDTAIENMQQYEELLSKINDIDWEDVPEEYTPEDGSISTLENYKNLLEEIAREKYPEFSEAAEEVKTKVETSKETFSELAEEMGNLQNKYTALTTAQNELNSTGQLTVTTFKSLVDNNLLSYLDVVKGKLVIGEKALLNEANAAKEAAIAKLQDEAATNILAIVEEDLKEASEKVESQQKETATSTTTDTNAKLANMKAAVANAISVQGLAEAYENERKAQEGSGAGQINWGALSDDATKKIQNEINRVNTLTTAINKLRLTAATPSKSRGSTTGSAEYEAQKAAEAAKKAEEEAYKARLKQFTDYMDEKERLEKRWVDKQKELGQLSNEDYMYITQQRIERYKKYLEEIKKATWMNAEDRLALEKEYSEKIEDLQVDYIGYLQDQLDDEIKALEDANEEKIKLIEEEADARIAALDKVTEATDRAREKENYENERQSILEEISYWEQRTGREAQEALKEAKEKLKELDAAWEDTQEDWSIEDQIKQIEEERDAEIAAIQAAQEAEIKAMQEVYDAKVKMFVETGEIIYEGSVIQAQSLYNAYKANFIDPISAELANLNKVTTTTTAQTQQQQQQYETYTIKAGDTLSKIARSFGTTVDKIMAANPYITNKNKIYAGKTLQIPKFHEGGIVGGNQEAFALLKPHEVILKTEWAASLNRMMKYFDNVTTGKTNGFTNNPVIEVKGNLIQIDADIKSKSDVDYLERRIEKMLKDKFNIKK